MMNPDLITRDEAAAILRIGTRTLDRWRASGTLRAYTVGSSIRFERSDVLGLILPSNPAREAKG